MFSVNFPVRMLISVLINVVFVTGVLFSQSTQVAQDSQQKRWNDLRTKEEGAKKEEKAKVIMEVEGMKKIVVHEGGRIKPLDTYARNILLIINGRSSFEGMDAIVWLARLIFDPEKTLDDRVFKINHDDILHALGIKPDKSRRYTYNELLRSSGNLFKIADLAMSREQNERSAADKEFIRIYNNFALYNNLMNNFLFALPVITFHLPDAEVKERLKLNQKEEYFSYLDIMESADLLQAELDQIKQKDRSSWEASDVFLWELERKYRNFLGQIQPSTILFIPSFSHGRQSWFNFTQVLRVANGKNIVFQEIKFIKEMVYAYRNGNQLVFDENLASYKNSISQKMISPEAKLTDSSIGSFKSIQVQVELFYNKLDPFYRSLFFYFPAFILLLLYLGVSNPWLKKVAFFLMMAGASLHFSGIILRFIITLRPPITNLFETFIFVGMVAVLISFLLERFNKEGVGLLVGAISGLSMIMISNSFASEGDTMAVLVAVLRSNFWLSTHVVTINLGYAGIVISGVIGHIYLFFYIRQVEGTKLKNVIRMVYATQAFGIIFTFIGTVLGGVWADQSWGRFWGWDPKENGSLLIVLWSAIIFHARMGGMIKDIGFAAGSVVGIVVVAVAWFGINLLGVGLHSYGFTAGLAQALYTYIGVQFILLFLSLMYIEYQNQKKNL